MKKISIAIDGPAGSGKSSTAKIVAEALGYFYVDTGKMYRAMTLAFLREESEINSENAKFIINNYKISVELLDGIQHTLLNGEDVSDMLMNNEIGENVSKVAAIKEVREYLVAYQRSLGNEGGVVMDGRDIGSNVLPDAQLKIYLTASIEERANRRKLQLDTMNIEADLEEIKSEIAERDRIDSTREFNPLVKSPDAIEIDTTKLSFKEQSATIVDLAKNKISNR